MLRTRRRSALWERRKVRWVREGFAGGKERGVLRWTVDGARRNERWSDAVEGDGEIEKGGEGGLEVQEHGQLAVLWQSRPR